MGGGGGLAETEVHDKTSRFSVHRGITEAAVDRGGYRGITEAAADRGWYRGITEGSQRRL